ncbi:MAG: sulfotransferase [Spirochaetota bacterium]
MIKKVIFICGAGHSGSTLLGLLLGSHPSSFYMGEAKKTLFLYDERKPEKKRYCKICGPDCKIWYPFYLAKKEGTSLYSTLEGIIGSHNVIDSSKDIRWIERSILSIQEEQRQAVLIYLKRDGRAVVNSRLRKYPNIPAEEHIQKWKQQIEKSNSLYESFSGNKFTVLYHQLTKEPEKTLQSICERVSISYEEEMMQFYKKKHHPLGGNDGTQSLLNQIREKMNPENILLESKRAYFTNHPQAIQHDSRWREQFSVENEELFYKMTATMNESFQEC